MTLRRRTHILGALLLLLLAILLVRSSSLAAPLAQDETPQPTPTPNARLSLSNNLCLSCHGQPGPSLLLENGEILDLYVSPKDYTASVHGSLGYACVQCHRQIGPYPHAPFKAKDLRDASLQLYQLCQGCHKEQYDLAKDSVHAAALAQGKREAAVCTDCHLAHNVRRLTKPGTSELLPDAHEWIPLTCSKCHNAIYGEYKDSVHGSALIGEGNPDVPTCIDCHGVHNIANPTTAAFRLRSPDICAKCHTDEKRMAKYGISTQVLNTYVADFHGTTVTLFEKMTPDAQTNKPVCYDCHGVHNIKKVSDPTQGLALRENLLKRCQRCHPDATSNFSAAWLSHYIPSPDKNPIVYYVNLFYKFLIPTVLGGMAVLVALDLNKSVSGRLRKSLRRPKPKMVAEKVVTSDSALPSDPAVDPNEAEQSNEAPVEPIQNEGDQPPEHVVDEEDRGEVGSNSPNPGEGDSDSDREANHD